MQSTDCSEVKAESAGVEGGATPSDWRGEDRRTHIRGKEPVSTTSLTETRFREKNHLF